MTFVDVFRCFIALSFSLFLVGCFADAGLNQSISGKSGSITAECASSIPENLRFSCQPTLKNSSSGGAYSLTENTCTQLSVDASSGKISAEKGFLGNAESCNFKLQYTKGNRTIESELISLTGTNDFSVSLSDTQLSLEKGATAKTLRINFDDPIPFDTDIAYFITPNDVNQNIPFSSFSESGMISVNKGMNYIDLSFQVPGASSFSGMGVFDIQLYDFYAKDIEIVAIENALSMDKIATGEYHTCGIVSGELFCWGRNVSGELGLSVQDYMVTRPTKVGSSTTWTELALGNTHSCGIDAGSLYCWGQNNLGQLGIGSSGSNVLTPTRVGTDSDWSHISAGASHTCGIRSGELYCWGGDSSQQLGNGPSGTFVNSPARVGGSSLWSDVSTGTRHTCGIDNGSLYCWGSDQDGALGNGIGFSASDVPIKIGSSSSWSLVETNYNNTCAIDSGSLYCWGRNNQGVLGVGDFANREEPTQVGTMTGWTHVSIGNRTACGIESNKLFCWGDDFHGQLGIGGEKGFSAQDASSPVEVDNQKINWTDVAVGSLHVCAIESSDVFCWGSANYAQLGIGNSSSENIISAVPISKDTDWESLDLSAISGCAIKTSGKLYCWGMGYALGQDSDNPKPGYVKQVGEASNWGMISAGGSKSICGIAGGALYCFGSNIYNSMNMGGFLEKTPKQYGSDLDWEYVSVGSSNYCAIKGGELYCWGSDSSEILGDGPGTTDQLLPVKIGSSNQWTKVAMTEFGGHNCGINDGKLYCWGSDNYGEVGNGAATGDVDAPEQIGVLTGWTEIANGPGFSCGIESGSLYCWGADTQGRLGNGTGTSNQDSPQKIGALTNWSTVSVGNSHSCGIESGRLFCWGRSGESQTGQPDIRSMIESPMQVGTDNTWTTIKAIEDYTCGIKAGMIYCFGDNAGQQIRPFQEITSPVKISF